MTRKPDQNPDTGQSLVSDWYRIEHEQFSLKEENF